MIRLAHFSDIHLTTPHHDWQAADWFSKRVTSWLNFRLLGRAARFAQADEVFACLLEELARREVDHFVFSGDATALGFEAEIRHAAEPLASVSIPGLAVPGNHDYCTPRAAASGHFERYFAAWQQGRRIGGHPYPFAQPVGPIWLIGVNAATGNVWPWDAGGAVDDDQLQRLKQLLGELEPGLRILVLHFPICLASGAPERFYHSLRRLEPLLDVANAGGVNLWLHGHRHSPYHFKQAPGARFPAICAGSATQTGIWTYGEYTIADNVLTAVRRAFDPSVRGFVDAETFTLALADSAARSRSASG
jgi:3',5'-cyclic AMP phosphodiesterase CpdA